MISSWADRIIVTYRMNFHWIVTNQLSSEHQNTVEQHDTVTFLRIQKHTMDSRVLPWQQPRIPWITWGEKWEQMLKRVFLCTLCDYNEDIQYCSTQSRIPMGLKCSLAGARSHAVINTAEWRFLSAFSAFGTCLSPVIIQVSLLHCHRDGSVAPLTMRIFHL